MLESSAGVASQIWLRLSILEKDIIMLNQTQLTIGSNNITLNEGLYSLNDLHKASGGEKRHQPSNWLALVQTKELVDTLIEEQNCTPEIPGVEQNQQVIKVVNGGNERGTFVCKRTRLRLRYVD